MAWSTCLQMQVLTNAVSILLGECLLTLRCSGTFPEHSSTFPIVKASLQLSLCVTQLLGSLHSEPSQMTIAFISLEGHTSCLCSQIYRILHSVITTIPFCCHIYFKYLLHAYFDFTSVKFIGPKQCEVLTRKHVVGCRQFSDYNNYSLCIYVTRCFLWLYLTLVPFGLLYFVRRESNLLPAAPPPIPVNFWTRPGAADCQSHPVTVFVNRFLCWISQIPSGFCNRRSSSRVHQ
jgi:hypothetical protein